MPDDKPQQDPAEGSREVIDRQLAQQDGKESPHPTPLPSETEAERRARTEPAEGSRETIDRDLAVQGAEGERGSEERPGTPPQASNQNNRP